MGVAEITAADFNSEVTDYKGKVLVDFWAPWCGPCRMQAPVLERLASSGIDVKIVKLNIDESPDIANRYSIQSIPTLIIFKDGNEIDRMIGAQPEEVLKAKLK